eukprot:CAMPEP_0201592386 /NCGR_PEP_ID=MMETSP0190_2-20130828/190301_1 /ASSEMBLY_ACC=CAM_ASM_000263 /TAXON_ID=37353 /ORGANISM="Rosalina sp." /LENGTH=307 /DNA_ID=CAMNT_0048051145 /DNA_START=17 /DNA_END=940 /DNA_ORIENTATION=-
MSVIAVYKQDEGPASDTNKEINGDFRLVLLTECSDYMKLTRGASDTFEFTGTGDVLDTVFNMIPTDPENEGDQECLDNKGFICSQLWQIDADDVPCLDSSGRDFSGNYALTFTPVCRSTDDIGAGLFAHCTTFLNDHPQLTADDRVALSTDLVWKDEHCNEFITTKELDTNRIALSTDLVWKDEICNPEIFVVQLGASMTFYDEDGKWDTPVDGSKLFQVGEDTIYVEVETNFPSDTLSVFNTEIIEVHICTFDPLVDPISDYNDPMDLENFGCFVGESEGRDVNYEEFFYKIFQVSPAISLFEFTE